MPSVDAVGLERVYGRVLQSFLVDDTPSPTTPPSPVSASNFAGAPPSPGPGPAAPPPVNAPGAAFVGIEAGGSTGSMSLGAANRSVNIPGLGSVSRQQMEAAEVRSQAAIQEALGSADLSHLTPADVQAVHARLESMRARGRLTNEQYAALSDGLAVLSPTVQG